MMDEVKGVKLLLTYEVKQEKLQEYYQFVMGSYLPALQTLGFQMSEAWHTAYGEAPSRLVGFVGNDESAMFTLVESDVWQSLNEQLEDYITNFDYKFIPYRGGFQF